ncbi:hypothetical protein FVF58_26130 [Paraburkholderia panacisoli]|uniref:Uncharacterized protein n=1 Tax=Paraburkholderia panacisoli TaxID=2603818 RepID=A0A5B0GUQ1_9BURK|nr:hypothetical protein [Paraburkholderia panacisoli]KAA1006532.1 hypothetical protein FVF58_26130 [Paraburkholderia panacisoli]
MGVTRVVFGSHDGPRFARSASDGSMRGFSAIIAFFSGAGCVPRFARQLRAGSSPIFIGDFPRLPSKLTV